MKEYKVETKNWIDAANDNDALYGDLILKGVRLLSAVTDQQLIVTKQVINSGYALWRAVNETVRVQKLSVSVSFEEQRTYWSRRSGNNKNTLSIEKMLLPTQMRDKEFRELIFSEEIAVYASGTESLQTQDNLIGRFTKSSFRVEKSVNNLIQIDIGIITIRDDEMQAVLDRFKPISLYKGKNRTYSITEIESKSGQDYNVAIVQCAGQGEGQGQKTANDLIEDLHPKWIFLVGIAGAIPSRDFTLGDVLLANRIHDFTITAYKEGVPDTYDQQGGDMRQDVIDFLLSLNLRKEDLDHWNSSRAIKCIRPEIVVDREKFEGDEEWKKKIQRSLEYHVKNNRKHPKFKVAPFGGGGALMRSPSHLQHWQESARHLEAVEMELAGVYRACRTITREYPIIAIRGISDVVGLSRDDSWTEYACNSAAAFAYALLRSGLINLDIP